MRAQTKPRIHHISDTPTGDVWIWRCNRPRCMEWTHTPGISVAPRGIGYGARWEQAARGLAQHMATEHPRRPSPIYMLPERRRRPVLLVAAVAGLVLGMVALVLSLIAMTDKEPDDMPADIPASTTPDECTAEYVEENGICLTWDDIREQPTYR